MSTLERAIEIAREAHAGQYDKAGADYIGHPLRVMEKGKTEEEKIVGVLHDVVEDSDWTFSMLISEGFSLRIISALRCLTKRSEDEDYDEFISRVLKDELAARVKLYDLEDNLDLSRLETISSADIKRCEKYRRARSRIIEGLEFIAVREVEWTEQKGGMEIVYQRRYDARGRVVGVSEQRFDNGEEVGHFAEYVGLDGYWRGGFYDAQVGFGGQTYHKFIEGEVK